MTARYRAPASSSGERDLLLDAWRGVSVTLVVCYHAVFYRFSNLFQPAKLLGNGDKSSNSTGLADGVWNALLQLIVYAGPLGVKFFFVISGYIITKIMLAENRRFGKISLRAFYIRRACRILPPLWLFIAAVFGASYLGWIQVSPHSFLYALAFLCNTSIQACYSDWFVVHLWSLSVEEQFYLVWPIVVVLCVRPALSTIALAFLFGLLILAQLSLLFVGEFNNGLSFACIAAGALYATNGRIRAGISSYATAPLVALAALLLFFRPLIPLLFPGQFRIHDLITPALICIVIFSSFEARTLLERQLMVRAFAHIGLVSYGLYMWQQLFLASPDRYLRHSLLAHTYLLFPVVVMSFILVEKPFMRLGSSLSRKMLSNAPPPTPESDGESFQPSSAAGLFKGPALK
jgi:peptidoglycan/LPS O-acetylase OafA/YrhL